MKEYEQIPFPPIRKATVDLLSIAVHKHMVHGLIEVDVTRARDRMRQLRRDGQKVPSLTSFIVHCCARIVSKNPMLHAYRTLRNRLVLFSAVDVSLPIERYVGESLEVIPSIIRDAERKSVREIDKEIADNRNVLVEKSRLINSLRSYLLIPVWIRRLGFRISGRLPSLVKRHFGTVMVTSVGMFGKGAGWGVPLCTHTLNVAIGGIVKRVELNHGKAVEREYLCMTVSFDHDIVDGAPAARFIHRFKRMVEQAEAL